MLKEWIDYNNNHPEANTSPASIFKNDYHNFDYYINNLDLKNPKPGLVEDSTFFALDVERNKMVGAVNIRHELNDYLTMVDILVMVLDQVKEEKAMLLQSLV